MHKIEQEVKGVLETTIQVASKNPKGTLLDLTRLTQKLNYPACPDY
jgi:hypothetical protein